MSSLLTGGTASPAHLAAPQVDDALARSLLVAAARREVLELAVLARGK